MKRFVLTSIFCVGMGGSALAAPPTPREKAGDRQAIREDRRETLADRWDAARLEGLAASYRAAVAGRAPAAKYAEYDRLFMAEMALELRETRVEVGDKALETKGARAELREEQGEVRRDVVNGRPLKAARDARDARDDRRDLADDQRDLALEAASLAQKRSVRDRYAALAGRYDAASLGAKLALIDQAIGLARAEVRGDVLEKREDVREKREDRRDGLRPD